MVVELGTLKEINDSKERQGVIVEFNKGEEVEAPRFQQYGLSSNPPKGSLVLGVSGKERSSFIATAVECKDRPKNLSEGDVTLYNKRAKVELKGDKVLINNADLIEVLNDLLSLVSSLCVAQAFHEKPIYPSGQLSINRILEKLNVK